MDGMENNNCHGLMPRLMGALRRNAFQSILLFRDEHLGAVTNLHSDVRELFTVQKIEETSQKDTLEILRGAAPAYEKHHGIKISDEALREAAGLTDRYRTDALSSAQPGRALQLLDMAASEFRLAIHSGPAAPDDPQAAEEWKARRATLRDNYLKQIRYEEKLADLKEKLAAEITAQEQKAGTEAEEPSPAAPSPKVQGGWSEMFTATVNGVADMIRKETPAIVKLREHVQAYERELKGLREQFQGMTKIDESLLVLKPEHIQAEFSQISGIPASSMGADETEKILSLEGNMKSKMYGQDSAVETVAASVKRAKAGLKDPNQPIGIYVCLGSSGTGKSFLGECLAEFLFDDPDAITIFDMSEYMEKHTVANLKGAPKGYAGYGEGGKLTNAVREKPYQVLLFDEVEKAHPDVFKITLQVFDKGRLTDEKGTADFSNTVILLTTNLGQNLSLDEDIDPEAEETQDMVKDALRQHGFPQEWINRVDGFLLFRALKPPTIHKILRRDIDGINRQIESRGFSVEIPDADLGVLIDQRYKREEGARQVKKFLTEKLKSKVADVVLANKAGGVIKASYLPGGPGGFSLEVLPAATRTHAPKSDLVFDLQKPATNETTPQAPAAFGQGGLAPKPAVPAP